MNIKLLKNTLLELDEYKTEKDIEGIEEITNNENDKIELLNYLQTMKKDSIVAKNSLFGLKKEKYEERTKIFEKAIDIICFS